MVFNAIFNNISVISWRSVLLVEETGGPVENHRRVAIRLKRKTDGGGCKQGCPIHRRRQQWTQDTERRQPKQKTQGMIF